MRRSILTLVVLLAAIGTAACADISAPKRNLVPSNAKHDWECLSGYTTSSGIYVCTDSSWTK